ncbi:MAG: TrmH family RNA methyltransferase [Patescibacteria group bacterium]
MTTNKPFYLIAHNIRSLYNIGTFFRTADALGIDKIFLTGYSGTPPQSGIAKVALGAENTVPWEQYKNISVLIDKLRGRCIQIVALELNKKSIDIFKFRPKFPLALLVGNEVRGISSSLLKQADKIIALPMRGKKESLNVGVAMAVAGYCIRYKK